MDDALVRELLADHARNPRNFGQLSDPDIDWEATNPQCVGPTHPEGDQVTVQATLSGDDPPSIQDIRFRGRGCTLSQATASLLTEQMSGTPLTEAITWDGDTIEEFVGMELTPSRLQCAELALVALRQGVETQGLTEDLSVE
jgi:nitrogen fixation NifU-like protein